MLTPRRRRRRHEGSSGQVIIIFALTFLLFLMGLIAMVIDLGAIYGYESQLQKAAQDAAIAGAADVNLPTFRSTGKVQLNGSYVSNCVAAGAADGFAVTCNHGPGGAVYAVQATATFAVPLPIPFFFSNATLKAQYSAFAQCGTNNAGATCD